MLELVGSLLAIYGSVLFGAVLSTIVLILCGWSWGQLPHLYLGGVRRLQSFFPPVYPKCEAGTMWPGCIKKTTDQLIRSNVDSTASFKFLLSNEDAWNLSLEQVHWGIEAIVQDDLSTAFDPAPSFSESLIRRRPLNTWTPVQTAVFYVSLIFRWSFLFPLRLCLLLSSFAYVAACCVVSFCVELTEKQKTSIAIIYCRLFCSGLGLVARYTNKEKRPRGPGVAISNHLSPNDIQILFADVPHGRDYGFVVTGQKHHGIIWVIERLVEKLCPAMWLDRKNQQERINFLEHVLHRARTGGPGGPVLVFPEGYCSNNTQCLQFRKAVFEDNVDIYPMAIKQTGCFGDSFWSEDDFGSYLLRVLSSWAIVYEVTYLDVARRTAHESSAQFAARCQCAIAEAAGIAAGPFDGFLWYRKAEQARWKAVQQETCAFLVQPSVPSRGQSTDSEDDFCIVPQPDTQRSDDDRVSITAH